MINKMKKVKFNKSVLRFGISLFMLFFVVNSFFMAPPYSVASESSVDYIDLTMEDVLSILGNLAGYFYSAAIVIAVILTIYVGILFFTAGGDDQQIGKAKKMMIWLIVGIAVLLIGRGVITFVRDILETGNKGDAFDIINPFV